MSNSSMAFNMNVVREFSTLIEGGYKKHHGCPVVFK